MSAIAGWLLTIILRFKYPAVFGLAMLGSFDVPIPTNSALMASAFFASTGYLDFFAVLAVSAVGSVLGDNAVYWLARHYGPRLLSIARARRWRISHWVDLVGKDVAAHPVISVFLGQFSPGLAPGINLLAGLAKMRYARFLAFEAAGSISSTAVNVLLGFMFGSNWQYLTRLFGGSIDVIVVFLLIVYVGLWHRFARRRLRKHQMAAPQPLSEVPADPKNETPG